MHSIPRNKVIADAHAHGLLMELMLESIFVVVFLGWRGKFRKRIEIDLLSIIWYSKFRVAQEYHIVIWTSKQVPEFHFAMVMRQY